MVIKYPPGPLRIILLIVNFTGLALIISSVISGLCFKNNQESGFLLSGIGSMLLIFYNIRRVSLKGKSRV